MGASSSASASNPLKVQHLPDWKLLLALTPLAVPIIGILGVWQAREPLHWTTTVVERDSYGNPLASYSRCTSPNASAYTGPLYGYVMFVLLLAALYAHRSRRAPAVYQEAKWIFLSLMNLVQVAIVLVPLNWLLDAEQTAALLLIRCASVLLVNALLLSFLFVPKFLAIHRLSKSNGVMGVGGAGASNTVAMTGKNITTRRTGSNGPLSGGGLTVAVGASGGGGRGGAGTSTPVISSPGSKVTFPYSPSAGRKISLPPSTLQLQPVLSSSDVDHGSSTPVLGAGAACASGAGGSEADVSAAAVPSGNAATSNVACPAELYNLPKSSHTEVQQSPGRVNSDL
jgi:hypothetical protein